MHEILDLPDSNIVGLKLSDTLTEGDHEAIAAHMEDVFEEQITTRAFFVLDNVEGWTPEDVWEDWAFDIRQVQDLDKAAVVADDPWDPWLDKLDLLFPMAQIQTFATEDEEEALDWIRGDMEVPGIGPGSAADPMASAQDEDDE